MSKSATDEPKAPLTRQDFEHWGSIGGKKRAKRLTPERRSEIAKIARQARDKSK